MNKTVLDKIKEQDWFYEISLPDGTLTKCYIPENVREIHVTRERALRFYLDKKNKNFVSAIDLACHEGYFSLILSEYFKFVIGIDKNSDSIYKGKLLLDVFNKPNINFQLSTLETFSLDKVSDFVLCFGLLYHVQNPIEIICKISQLAKKAICLETQVVPHEIQGSIENGSYMWQRKIEGNFVLCEDHSSSKEGGATDIALVPSLNAILYLLKYYQFKNIEIYKPCEADYEQFIRGQRVIIYAEKSDS